MKRLFRLLVVVLGYGLAAMLVNTPAAAESPPLRILALGDSLTAGLGLARAEAFPARLEAALRQRGHDVVVVNAGVSGDTTAGGLARLDWLLAQPVDAAIVELGANDGLRGLDPAGTEDNLDAILNKFAAHGVPVLLSGMMAPPNLGRPYTERFNAIFPRLAEKHDVVFDPFFLEGVAAVPDLNQDDAIHPNAAGVARIVERIVPLAEELIERAKASP